MSTGILDTARRFKNNDIRTYAVSHVDAFNVNAAGARIPTMAAPPTAVTRDYQSIRFTATSPNALIVLNYNALRVSPVVVLQGDISNPLNFDNISDATVDISYLDTTNNTTFTRPIRVGGLGATMNEILTNSVVGKQMANLSDFTQLRLVSGGYKLWKTSRQENESGVI